MVSILPEEIYSKVEEPLLKKPPVSRARLLRAMENIDRAQVRTEQEQLKATVTEYSKKAITPSLIDSLEVRRKAVPSLATVRASLSPLPVIPSQVDPEPVVGGEARVPLSSVAPHRTGEGRRLPEPEPVFRSDEEFESAKASLDAKGISDVQVFGEVPKSYWEKQKEVKRDPHQSLVANKDKNFARRALEPDKFPSLKNPDGSVSTHLMAAETVGGGAEPLRHIAFPTIVQQPDGSLRRLPLREAQAQAIQTGELIEFGTLDEALDFSINYKQGGRFDAVRKEGLRPLMGAPKQLQDESGMKGLQVIIGKMPEGYLEARRAEFEEVVPEVGKNLSLIAPEVSPGPSADFAIDRTKAELAEESELMGEAGPEFLGEMQIKPGVNVSELRPEMKEGFEMVKGLYNAVGVDTKDILLTDAKTKRRTYTLHDVGFGADFGWKTLNKDQREGIIDRLNALAEIKHPLKNGGRFWRIGDYDVLVHKIKGNEWHFHLEYEKGKPELDEYWKDLKYKRNKDLPYAEEV